MNQLKALDLSHTNITSIEGNAFSNINSGIDIIFPQTLKFFSKNSFVNVKFNEFKVLKQYELPTMSFNKCQFDSIIIDTDVAEFSVGPFYKCGKTLNINHTLNERFSLNDHNYLIYKNTSDIKTSTNELIFVPEPSTHIVNISEKHVEPYALSYCPGCVILTDQDKLESLIHMCKDDIDSIDVVLSSEAKTYDSKYYSCNAYNCKLNCRGYLIPTRTPFPTPVQTPETISEDNKNKGKGHDKDGVSKQTPILSVNDDGKTVQLTVTISNVITQTESDIETNQITITNTNSSLTTTYTRTFIRTWTDIETLTYTNAWMEYNEPETRRGLSTGKVILLVSGGIFITFLICMMGLYLYRRTKDDSERIDTSSSSTFIEIEDDIGYVIDPNFVNDRQESTTNLNCEDNTDENPMFLIISQDIIGENSDNMLDSDKFDVNDFVDIEI